MTPPERAFLLKDALGAQCLCDVVVDGHAGHFTFMGRRRRSRRSRTPTDAFLASLAAAVAQFVTG